MISALPILNCRLDSADLGGGAPDPAGNDSSTGKRLGDFELLRELGRGGPQLQSMVFERSSNITSSETPGAMMWNGAVVVCVRRHPLPGFVLRI